MPLVLIDKDRCKGCELCVHACPQQILSLSKEINQKGFFFSRVADQSRCIGCRVCAISCPDVAIEIMTQGVQYCFFDY